MIENADRDANRQTASLGWLPHCLFLYREYVRVDDDPKASKEWMFEFRNPLTFRPRKLALW